VEHSNISFVLQIPEQQPITLCSGVEDTKHYEEAKKCVEELALYLKPLSSARGKCSYKTHAKQVAVC
jgi:RING finger/CCCH-type zinc finger protein